MPKKLLLLIFSILFIQGINAQKYEPMLGDTTLWYVLYDGTYVYYAIDDTVFNNKTYKILNMTYGRLKPSEDIFSADKTTFGYIREDTLKKKIYMLPYQVSNQDTLEIIYFDFSLSENDSLLLYDLNYDSIGYFRVDSIRNFNTLAGNRRAFYLNNPKNISWENPIWVEGIGTLGNIELRDLPPQWYGYGELNCFFKDNIHIYQSELSMSQDSCLVFISSVEKLNSNPEITIYPVPATSEINIKTNNIFPFAFYLFNLEGKVLISINNQTNLDISNLSPGMYFYKLINMDNGKVHCGKILKE